jgi:hypothetical protein
VRCLRLIPIGYPSEIEVGRSVCTRVPRQTRQKGSSMSWLKTKDPDDDRAELFEQRPVSISKQRSDGLKRIDAIAHGLDHHHVGTGSSTRETDSSRVRSVSRSFSAAAGRSVAISVTSSLSE